MTTRRFTEPPQQPVPPRPCLRCQTPMGTAEVRTVPGAYGLPALYLVRTVGRSWLGPKERKTTCWAWVCPTCGYTELVAYNPQNLFPTDH